MDAAQCVTAFKERQAYISVCFFKIEGYRTAGVALRIDIKNYSVLLVGRIAVACASCGQIDIHKSNVSEQHLESQVNKHSYYIHKQIYSADNDLCGLARTAQQEYKYAYDYRRHCGKPVAEAEQKYSERQKRRNYRNDSRDYLLSCEKHNPEEDNIDKDIKRNKCALVRRLKIISHKKPRHEAQKHGIGYRQKRHTEFEPFIC